MRIQHFLTLIGIVATMLGLTACARLEGENWPSLREGFVPRDPLQVQADEAVAAPGNAGSTREPSMTSAQPPAALAVRVEEKLEALEEMLRQVEEGAGEGDWYATQLELTRLSRMLDEVRPYPEMLVELQGALRSAKDRLERIKPEPD